jgi:hypothetical protein
VQQPPSGQPFVVQIVQTPQHETTLKDVFVGAFGITGSLVILALAAGALMALILVRWNKRHPPEADHLPPVA